MPRSGARSALIAINPGVDIHWGTCTTIWGTPDLDDLPRKPKIPVAAVNKPDGEKLIALRAQGGRATIRTELEEGWFVQKIPVVHIPGAVEPEHFVLVHGHYDSWDVGVGDNATGDATLLELARVLWTHRDRAAALGPHRVVARPFDRALCRQHLVQRCLRAGPRRQLRRPDQLRFARLPLGDQLPPDHLHERDAGDGRAT